MRFSPAGKQWIAEKPEQRDISFQIMRIRLPRHQQRCRAIHVHTYIPTVLNWLTVWISDFSSDSPRSPCWKDISSIQMKNECSTGDWKRRAASRAGRKTLISLSASQAGWLAGWGFPVPSLDAAPSEKTVMKTNIFFYFSLPNKAPNHTHRSADSHSVEKFIQKWLFENFWLEDFFFGTCCPFAFFFSFWRL